MWHQTQFGMVSVRVRNFVPPTTYLHICESFMSRLVSSQDAPTNRIRVSGILRSCFATIVILVWFCTGTVFAEDWNVAMAEHSWGSFLSGSWKTVRVINTEFDSSGNLLTRSTTQTETVLEEVSTANCVLSVKTQTEMVQGTKGASIQKFASEPSEATLAFRTTSFAKSVQGREKLMIDGRGYIATVYEFRSQREGQRVTRRIWHVKDSFPSVLKEVVEVRPKDDSEKVLVHWESLVTSLRFSVHVLDDRCRGWQVRTIRRTPDRTMVTVEYHCPQVPGTIVQATSTTSDVKGNMLRQSRLELRAYGACYEEPLKRRRPLRAPRRRSPEDEPDNSESTDVAATTDVSN